MKRNAFFPVTTFDSSGERVIFLNSSLIIAVVPVTVSACEIHVLSLWDESFVVYQIRADYFTFLQFLNNEISSYIAYYQEQRQLFPDDVPSCFHNVFASKIVRSKAN